MMAAALLCLLLAKLIVLTVIVLVLVRAAQKHGARRPEPEADQEVLGREALDEAAMDTLSDGCD